MTVAALIGVDNHGRVGRMTRHAERGVKDVTVTCRRVINRVMGRRRPFVIMTAETVHCAVVGVLDHIMNQGAGGADRVDITGSVMTGGAQ